MIRGIITGLFLFAVVNCKATDKMKSWETQSCDWDVEGCVVKLDGGGERTLAWRLGQPSGKDIESEVTVIPEKRTAKGWAIAAVSIRQDEKNYWHLALVESPDDHGNKHFVELSEMLDGNWLAQSAKETKLTASAWQGSDFNWQYGKKYQLKIVLNPEGIEGTVSEIDGTIRTHIAYRFDKCAVNQGMPVLAGGAMAATFENFRAEVKHQIPPPPAKVFPSYSGSDTEKPMFKGSGFFRVEKKRGKWWLVDPNGRQFYLVGTDHINFRGHWCEKLGYAPYGRLAKEKYGNEDTWVKTTLQRLKEWGFNALPAGHSPSLRYGGLPHIEFLSLGSNFAGRDALCPKTTWTGFPDIFSPKWARYCDSVAHRVCAENKDNQWLVGYFLDNELEWYGKNHKLDGLFVEAWKLDKDRPGKNAWIDFLQKEFGNISSFNSAFGTSFSDFAALAVDITPRKSVTEKGVDCCQQWIRHVAVAYFKTCADAIHKHDPNHLILGCRFAGRAPDIWDIAGKYCDVVSFNIYPRIDVDGGVPESVLKQVNEWADEADRPMMVTEWSFPALDAGLPSIHGAGMRVDTQEQRAKCFSHFQDFLFRLPYIVGSCYFMYLDEPALGISSTFPEDSNYGLISETDEPYPAITSAATLLNPQALQRHREGKFKPFRPAKHKLPGWLCGSYETKPYSGEEIKLTSGQMILEGPMGNKGWRMRLDGKPVADLFPVIHQKEGADFWVQPSNVKILGTADDGKRMIVDMEFIRTEGALVTDVKPSPRPFRTVMRYWIPKSTGGWVASQCLSVQNTGLRAWRLEGIFHYMIPLPAVEGSSIEPLRKAPNYYRSANAWVDLVASRGAGCWFYEEGSLKCNYWKGDGGSFHSDLREEVDVELKPGDIYEASPEAAFFFPLSDVTIKTYGDTCGRILREISD